MTPEEIARDTEWSQQAALMCWAALNADRLPELRLLFHIPNGGTRNVIEAARLKAAGVKPGVPDLFLPVGRQGQLGLFVEMKRPGKLSQVSLDQKLWAKDLIAQGYKWVVCDNWQVAARIIESYITGKFVITDNRAWFGSKVE